MKRLLLLTAVSFLAAGGCTLMPESGSPDSARGQPSSGTKQTSAAEETGSSRLNLAETMLEPQPKAPEPERNTDLWDRLRDGFALNLERDNRRIRVQRQWYLRHPAYLDRVATRAERYLYHIVEEAEERDIPLELALLPVVESAFDPFSFSHGRAAGPWQFIPGTGDRFGLKRSYWYDARRDILASTDAAFDYLEALAHRFEGDWLLALAAYNAGAGNVARAIRLNENQGKPTDYWSLRHLPRETRAYVPKLLAIAQVVADPDQYDVSLKSIADQPYFETVELDAQISLRHAAKLAQVDRDELHMLNPGLNRWATPPDGPHRLLVPVERAEPFRTALAEQSGTERTAWRSYRIQRGDSLIAIARRFGTRPEVLREVNNLSTNTIVAGNTLRVPDTGGPRKVRVDAGDSLWTIAQQHDLGVDQLARRNNLSRKAVLQPGQELVLQGGTGGGTSTKKTPDMVREVRYAVRRGDSLYRIARRFSVSINQIQRWNGIDRQQYLQPGQQLTLYVDIRNTY